MKQFTTTTDLTFFECEACLNDSSNRDFGCFISGDFAVDIVGVKLFTVNQTTGWTVTILDNNGLVEDYVSRVNSLLDPTRLKSTLDPNESVVLSCHVVVKYHTFAVGALILEEDFEDRVAIFQYSLV